MDKLAHSYIGTEHLLLGLLRTESAAVATIIPALGATVQDLREDTLALLGHGIDTPEPAKEEPWMQLPLVAVGVDGQIAGLNDVAANGETDKCTCQTSTLMTSGCQCGSMKKDGREARDDAAS